MKFVKINHVCLRGLIQLRNDLVGSISSNKLPEELKNEDRICSKCPQLRMCSLLRDPKSSNQDSIGLYDKSIGHLNDAHKDFFKKWYGMLEFEFGNAEYKQFESGELVWWKSKRELEATGFAVFDLVIYSNNSRRRSDCAAADLPLAYDDEAFALDRFFPLDLVKTNGFRAFCC